MSSTLIHDLSIVSFGGALTAIGVWQKYPPAWVTGAGMLFGGLWLSPDLDWGPALAVGNELKQMNFGFITRELNSKRLVYGKICRRWPPPFRRWWQLFAWLFRHRGPSHYPILGLMLRGIWIFPVTAAITYFLWPASIFVWTGMFVADCSHLILDGWKE